MTEIELGHESADGCGEETIYVVRGTWVPPWRGSRDEPPGGGYHEDIEVETLDGRGIAERDWPWRESYIQEKLWEAAAGAADDAAEARAEARREFLEGA